MTWLTFVGAAVFSYFTPFVVAVYIILFDLYWVLKAINTAMHLLSSFFKLQLHASYDWRKRVEALGNIESYKNEKQGLNIIRVEYADYVCKNHSNHHISVEKSRIIQR